MADGHGQHSSKQAPGRAWQCPSIESTRSILITSGQRQPAWTPSCDINFLLYLVWGTCTSCSCDKCKCMGTVKCHKELYYSLV